MAARFAKLGINMVRIHGGLFDRKGDDPTKIDAARLDNYFYLINALKEAGHLRPSFQLFSPLAEREGERRHSRHGRHHRQNPLWAAHLRAAHAGNLQIVDQANPHHEKPLLRQDPGGGNVGRRLRNPERRQPLFLDSFKPATLGKGPRELLEKKFGAWLAKKYGSLDQAFAAWPGDKHPDDSAADSAPGFTARSK